MAEPHSSHPKPVPAVRVDREFFLEQERFLAESLLRIAATMVNEIAKGGTIYPNVILPPEQAARKQQLTMEG